MRARKSQKGFTLIDMTVVFVVTSVVAATAIPSYIGMKDDAKRSASRSIAGALASASANNFLLRGKGLGVAITNCADAANLMLGGAMTGYTIQPKAVAPSTLELCTLDHQVPGAATAANFAVYGVL